MESRAISTEFICDRRPVKEVMSSIPVKDSFFFFFVPQSCHVDQFTFHISLPSLTFTIFIHLSRNLYIALRILFDLRLIYDVYHSLQSHLSFCNIFIILQPHVYM